MTYREHFTEEDDEHFRETVLRFLEDAPHHWDAWNTKDAPTRYRFYSYGQALAREHLAAMLGLELPEEPGGLVRAA